MSYRELRNLAEMLRALGYPRLVSIENFRAPNFPLVAEVLAWVVKRFDPHMEDLPSDVDSEQERVIFVRTVAQFMASKAHVRLNTKKLYQADGFAVQEVLKALTLLYAAIQSNQADDEMEEHGDTTHNFDVTSRTGELKQIRSLASNITSRGATLFDLLRREVNLREMRTNVINRPLEVVDVERGLQEAIAACENDFKETQKAIENVATDEATVEAKCEKKKTALERNQKRLMALKKVRPAFMDEYEKLEEDLKIHYNIFIQRFMSLSYLEQKLEENEKVELSQVSQKEAANRRALDLKAGDGTFAGFGNDTDDDSAGDGDDDDDEDDEEEYERPLKTSFKTEDTDDKKVKGSRVFGSMTGDGELDSLGSETDLNLDDDDHGGVDDIAGGVKGGLMGVLDDDDDEGGVEGLLGEDGGLSNRSGGIGGRMRRPAAAVTHPDDDDDNDF